MAKKAKDKMLGEFMDACTLPGGSENYELGVPFVIGGWEYATTRYIAVRRLATGQPDTQPGTRPFPPVAGLPWDVAAASPVKLDPGPLPPLLAEPLSDDSREPSREVVAAPDGTRYEGDFVDALLRLNGTLYQTEARGSRCLLAVGENWQALLMPTHNVDRSWWTSETPTRALLRKWEATK